MISKLTEIAKKLFLLTAIATIILVPASIILLGLWSIYVKN
jgi:hypothetical protein